MEFLNTNIVCSVPGLPNSLATTTEGNPLDPSVLATTSKLTPAHPPILATTQSSSCSSVVLTHNSREVIPGHNPYNTMCLTPILSHNSRIRSGPQPMEPQQTHQEDNFKSHVEHLSQVLSRLINTVGTSSLNVPLRPCLLKLEPLFNHYSPPLIARPSTCASLQNHCSLRILA